MKKGKEKRLLAMLLAMLLCGSSMPPVYAAYTGEGSQRGAFSQNQVLAVNPEYTASADESVENGTFELSKDENGTVTVVPKPASGYQLKAGSLEYRHKDADENGDVTVTTSVSARDSKHSYKTGDEVPNIADLDENEWLLFRNHETNEWGGVSSTNPNVWAGQAGSYGVLKFTGTSITINGTVPDTATVTVTLDDEEPETLSTASKNTPIFEKEGLQSAQHIIKLEIAENSNTGNFVDIYETTILDQANYEAVPIEGDSFEMPEYDVIVTGEFEPLAEDAVWTVTFQDGDAIIKTAKVAKDTAAEEPEKPTKSGYTFGGWYSDAALETPYDFTAAVTADIILYAKWTAKEPTQVESSGMLEDIGELAATGDSRLLKRVGNSDDKFIEVKSDWLSGGGSVIQQQGAVVRNFKKYLTTDGFTLIVNAKPKAERSAVSIGDLTEGGKGIRVVRQDGKTSLEIVTKLTGEKLEVATDCSTKVDLTKQLVDNQWQTIALAYDDSSEQVNVYIDGEPANEQPIDIGFKLSDFSDKAVASVGTSYATGFQMAGLYDSVEVLTGALDADTIRQIHEERAADGFITDEEYQAASKAAADEEELARSRIQITAADVDKAAANWRGWAYKGFGMLNGNGTSNLLLDYKAEHPDEYWQMMNYLFGGEFPLFTHIKMEMGNDGNNSTSAEACTMRPGETEADVSRSPGFVMAADAKMINPDVKISFLRWEVPSWVGGDKDYANLYEWYRQTIFDAYRKFGYVVDFVSPDRNETGNPDAEFIKYFAQHVREESDFPAYFTEEAKNAYHNIMVYASDENKGNAIFDRMKNDRQVYDDVFAAAWHYRTNSDKAEAKTWADANEKEMWYSEGCATFGYSELHENKNLEYGAQSIGGFQSPLALMDSFITAFDSSRRTHYIFQPALGGFYDGLQYAHKELLGGRDPWSGYIHYDPALKMLQHFTSFAKTGWEDNYYEGDNPDTSDDKIWRVVQAATAGAFEGTTNEHATAGINGRAGYMTLVSPDKTDFSTVFVNNTQNEKTYTIAVEDTLTGLKDRTLQKWVTKTGSYLQQEDPIAVENGVWTVTLPAYSIVTVTTLDHEGTAATKDVEAAKTAAFMDIPANTDGIRTEDRTILDTDKTGRNPDTTDDILYADDFEYDEYTEGLNWTVNKNGTYREEKKDYLTARGGEPRYMLDTHGAFTVEDGQLIQALDKGVGQWNGGDPCTIVGDFRWTNYKAGIDVDFTQAEDSDWGGIGIRTQTGMNWNGNGYTLHIEKNGTWNFYRANERLAGGKVAKAKDVYRLEVEGRGNYITAYIDGIQVADYTDTNPLDAGRVKISCAWNRVAFDNLTVEKCEGFEPYVLSLIDGQDPSVEYEGSWDIGGSSPAGGSADDWYRTLSRSKDIGASFSFKTSEGTGFAIIGPNDGSAKLTVEVDGKQVAADAPTLATQNRYATYTWSGSPKGKHDIKVTVTEGALVIDGIYTVNDPATPPEIVAKKSAQTAPTVEHGTLTFDPNPTTPESEVTVTARPDSGYRLVPGTLSYYNAADYGGKEITESPIYKGENASINPKPEAEVTAETLAAQPLNTWWLTRPGDTAWGGDATGGDARVWGNTVGAAGYLRFEGNGIRLNATTKSGCKIGIYLDGEQVKLIEGASGSPCYEVSGLPNGSHSLKFLIEEGNKEEGDSGYIDIRGATVEKDVEIAKTPITGSTFTMPDYNVYVEANFEEIPEESRATVTYNYGYGDPIDFITEKGEPLTEPEAPKRAGYVFDGWYTDEALTESYDFSAPVTADLTLYAKWTEQSVPGETVTVNFNSNGGSIVAPQQVEKGTALTEPSAPVRGGYTFLGWYTDETLSTLYDFSTPVTDDMTLYAGWRRRSSHSGGGSSGSSGGGTAIRPSDKKDDDKKSEDDKKDEQKTPERQPDQSSNTQPTTSFPDVKSSDWYAPAVDYVSSRGMMQGSSAGFRPNDLLTRGMIAQVIFNLEGSKPVSAAAAFTDVKSSDWYAPAAGWVSANGVMSGYSSGAFGANDSITREQLAVTLYQYAKLKGCDLTKLADLGTFRDGASVSDWAMEAVRWATANGLLSGKSGGLLDPGGKATRAEVASILMRFCESLAK